MIETDAKFPTRIEMLMSEIQAHRWIRQKIGEEGKSPEGLCLPGLRKTTLP
jgi:hypothetical protein